MNGKTILSAILSALTGFLSGWLIYGLILKEFMKNAMVQYEGLYKDPPAVWAIFVANLCFGLLFSWLYQALKVTKFAQGFFKGVIIALLFTISFDCFIYAQMNIYNSFAGVFVDIIASTVLGALMGGVAALVLGFGKQAD